MTILIVTSSVTLCLGTLEEYNRSTSIPIIEFICGVAFTVDFVARIFAWQGPHYAILFDFPMWVDGLSVLPIYIGLIVSAVEGGCDQLALNTGGEAREHCLPTSLMLLRLVRLLRLLKLVGHAEDSAVLGEALRRAARPLLVPLFFSVLLTFAFAGTIYYAEGVVGGSSDFDNIFKAAWFVLVTLTTVGYGDRAPVSRSGRTIAGIWMVMSLVAVSSITAGLASAFTLSLAELAPSSIRDKSDLRGKKIAVVEGTTSLRWGKLYEIDPTLTKNLNEAINMLNQGKVEGVIFDEAPLRHYLKENEQSKLKLANFPLAVQTYGFVLPMGSPLRNPLNIELLAMERNGETEKIESKLLD